MLARCIAPILLLGAAVSARGQSVGLTRVGDSWRYFLGISEPSAVPGSWLGVDFDDTEWLSGRAGFSIGYGANEATGLPYLPVNYSTVYFRRTFDVEEPSKLPWLTFRIDYSDGFIAYLNGQEIARRNVAGMPGTLVPASQLSTNIHLRGNPEEFVIPGGLGSLKPGPNTLAVQVHSAYPTGTLLCFMGELLASFNRGPYLQNMSSNHVQIVWKTPLPTTTQLDYGLTPTLGTLLLDTNLVTTHVVNLNSLDPDTSYYYQASSTLEGQTAQVPMSKFHTFKPAGPVRFVAFGDGGWNSVPQYQIAEVMRKQMPDLVLEAGDIVYPQFTSALADSHLLSVYQPHMENTPYFPALGNHDLLAGVGHYLETFYLPTNSVSLTDHALALTSPEHYYSFDHGDVHFTVLFVPFLNQHKPRIGDAQYNWLVQDLASTRQPWKIAVWHVPMSSSSAHRNDDMDLNGVLDRLEIRDVFLPVLSQAGVQLVLCGHEHGYERFIPTNGVHAITTGGGGVPLYGFLALDDASAVYSSRYNCVSVEIDKDELQLRALGVNGEIFDQMVIRRGLPAVADYQAAWHTPVVEDTPLPGVEPNIPGQIFDFVGPAIPTLTGQFSNLGEVYVNNDGTNLFVGLSKLMKQKDDDVILFVGTPRFPGSPSLKEIGNGQLDPTGEGADGLDFLSNLSFTNFAPAIGCLLGHEAADGQFRSFLGTNGVFNSGQGVFFLAPGLSNVPGVKIQQFRLSPQPDVTPPGLGNAQFIELSIPLEALGIHQPGEEIQLGAVVARPIIDAKTGTRVLDTGFLGTRLAVSDSGMTTLEALKVRLAFDPDGDDDSDGLSRETELALGTDPANADSDGDRLPDGWEVAFGLNPLTNGDGDGAMGDPDNDRASNSDELASGTDPSDPTSVLRLRLEHSGRELGLVWETRPGRSYQLQSSKGALTNFVDIPNTKYEADSGISNLTFRIFVPSDREAGQYFRLRVDP